MDNMDSLHIHRSHTSRVQLALHRRPPDRTAERKSPPGQPGQCECQTSPQQLSAVEYRQEFLLLSPAPGAVGWHSSRQQVDQERLRQVASSIGDFDPSISRYPDSEREIL